MRGGVRAQLSAASGAGSRYRKPRTCPVAHPGKPGDSVALSRLLLNGIAAGRRSADWRVGSGRRERAGDPRPSSPDRVTTIAAGFPQPPTSSVRYEVGIFRDDEETAAAQGYFVHVYVDRASTRPVPALPESLREVLEPLLVSS